MKKGKLLIISGFSGVGKGTVVKYILDNYSDYKISISATTRSITNCLRMKQMKSVDFPA